MHHLLLDYDVREESPPTIATITVIYSVVIVRLWIVWEAQECHRELLGVRKYAAGYMNIKNLYMYLLQYSEYAELTKSLFAEILPIDVLILIHRV